MTRRSALLQNDTRGHIRTVNGVQAKGGSLGAPGPLVANVMFYVGSGSIGGVGTEAGNLLLAISVSSVC